MANRDFDVKNGLIVNGAMYFNSGTLSIGNSTVNVAVNSSIIDTGLLVINSSSIAPGSNVILDTTRLHIGNSTANIVVNSTSIDTGSVVINSTAVTTGSVTLGATTVTTTGVTVGASTIDVGANVDLTTTQLSIGNSTVNTVVTSTTIDVGANVDLTTTQLSIGNSTVNAVLTSTGLDMGTAVINSTAFTTSGVTVGASAIDVGANVDLTTTMLSIGNSTVNTVVTSTTIDVGANVDLTTTQLSIGNSTVNSVLTSSGLDTGSVVVNSTAVTTGGATLGATSVTTSGVTIGPSAIDVGANVDLTTTLLSIGNSTVNTVVTSTTIDVGANVDLTTTQLSIGNSTVNTVITSLGLDAGVVVVNNTVVTTGSVTLNADNIDVGANVDLTTTTLSIGNSTANVQVTSTDIDVGANVDLTSSMLSIGNSTVNSVLTSAGLDTGSVVVNSTAVTTGSVTVGATTVTTSSVTVGASTIDVGANVDLTTTGLDVGNSTVNVQITSTDIDIGANVDLTATGMSVGNTTVNVQVTSAAINLSANAYISGSLNGGTLRIGNATSYVLTNSTSTYYGANAYISVGSHNGLVFVGNATHYNYMNSSYIYTATPGVNFQANSTYLIVQGSGMTSVVTNAIFQHSSSGFTWYANSTHHFWGEPAVQYFSSTTGYLQHYAVAAADSMYINASSIFIGNGTQYSQMTKAGGSYHVSAGGSMIANATYFYVGKAGGYIYGEPTSAYLTVANATVTSWFGAANISCGANAYMTTSLLNIGNSTVYARVNSTAFSLNGVALTSGINAAAQADMETATSTTLAVTPGRQHYHPAHPKALYSGTITPTAVTGSISSVDTATNIITWSVAHGLSSGDAVIMWSSSTMPAPLVMYGAYYIYAASSTTFTVHLTRAAAIAGTSAVDLTTAGAGTRSMRKLVPSATHSYNMASTGPVGGVAASNTTGFEFNVANAFSTTNVATFGTVRNVFDAGATEYISGAFGYPYTITTSVITYVSNTIVQKFDTPTHTWNGQSTNPIYVSFVAYGDQ